MQHCVEQHRNSYCYYAHSEEVKEAHSFGLSYGKYRAYLELKEIAPEILPEDVQEMTMKEIREWEAELRNMKGDTETEENNITMGSIWEEIGTGIILNKKDMPEKIFSLQSKLFPVL